MQAPLSKMRIRQESLKNIFGMVRNHGHRPHQGWDIEASVGTPTYAISMGTISDTGTSGDYGKFILLEFKKSGSTYYAFYGHLSKILVKKGDQVFSGAMIGETGKTGNASNLPAAEHHLHFEIRIQKNVSKGLEGRIDPGEIVGYKYYSCSVEPIEG